MRSLNSIIVFVLLLLNTSKVYSMELFSWTTSASSPRLILGLKKGQNYDAAVRRYLEAYNAKADLVELNEEKLKLDIVDTAHIEPRTENTVRFAVLANDPWQMRGPQNGKTWFKMLADAGAEVYVIPVSADAGLTAAETAEFHSEITKNFDAVLALGGGDIDPALYGDENREAINVVPTRDKSEFAVLRAFIAAKRGAVFGICRGHQMIAAVTGYKLHQDLKMEWPGNPTDHYDDHEIELLPVEDSILREYFSEKMTLKVNSIHHQAVKEPTQGQKQNLVVIAYDKVKTGEAPVIEALQFKDRRGFTVQFHPERMRNQTGKRIFSAFVDVAKKYAWSRRANKKSSCQKTLIN